MTIATLESPRPATSPSISGRRGLADFMQGLCRRTGADAYMVLDTAPGEDGQDIRILVSDWTFNAIHSVGIDAIHHIAESSVSAFMGMQPRSWHPLALAVLLDREEIASLNESGHEEIVALKLRAGTRRYSIILSAARSGVLDCETIATEHMTCCYALARLGEAFGPVIDNPLSERERECLLWVSQGKTTEEVGLILDVSSNTINSYIAHAIHKLAASNRAMAIAGAIRRNLI